MQTCNACLASDGEQNDETWRNATMPNARVCVENDSANEHLKQNTARGPDVMSQHINELFIIPIQTPYHVWGPGCLAG